MQLKGTLLTLLLLVPLLTFSQENATDQNSQPLKKLTETEVNFLFNYYSQKGNNSAVTGGTGTEKLTNTAPAVMINIPLDTSSSLQTYFGFDNYSSASTDNIDNNISSASSRDTRYYINATYFRTNKKNETYSIKGGFSREYDYTSTSVGLGWTKEFNQGNTEIGVAGTAYFDTWMLIYPAELRGGGALVNTDKRQSYNFSATYTQVINKKLQASLSGEFVYQTGLLSTPFHRVYFDDGVNNTDPRKVPKVEQLPGSRLKIPVGLRLNYYLNDYLVLRSYYRFYMDDFEINAHTFNLEVPVKVGGFFIVYPFFRYHTQTASKFFAPFGKHNLQDEFYTSDYDLSAINSTIWGLGLRYSPLYGLLRFKGPFAGKSDKVTQFKSIDIRLADYKRQGNNPEGGGDLSAISLSFGLTFVF